MIHKFVKKIKKLIRIISCKKLSERYNKWMDGDSPKFLSGKGRDNFL